MNKRFNIGVAIVVPLILAGCATPGNVEFNVDSQPRGSIIEVNGLSQGVTPTRISLPLTKKWVGLIHSPNGWSYVGKPQLVKALPPPDYIGTLYSQNKYIDPTLAPEGGDVFFDLRLQNVEPLKNYSVDAR